LVRALSNQWYRVRAAAQFVTNEQDLSKLRAGFSMIEVANRDIPWIGFADISGKIMVASHGVLEGEKVTERPWFRAGAEGPYVNYEHELLLLASHLSQSGEMPRLVNFALPVFRNDARIGVIAMHIDWAWVRSLLEPFDQRDGVDIILLSREGEVLVGPPALLGQKLRQQSALAAGQGVKVSMTETWPDGVTYLVTATPVPIRSDLPSFGWSVLVRQPAALAFAPVQSFTQWALILAAIATVLCLALALFIAGLLSRPMKRLAEAARNLTCGQVDQPVPDERAYREAGDLASALVNLQSTVLGQAKRHKTGSRKAREFTVV
jgi:HAMP domain-containing protein